MGLWHFRIARKMKLISLAGTALLAFVALEPAAQAQRVNFTYTGTLVTFTVPATGLYQILAFGAQGGSGTYPFYPYYVGAGGLGAESGSDFTLTAGESLQIAVGGAGSDNATGGGGGGGGSFVVGPGNTPMVIAGGGGGGGASAPFGPNPGGGGLTGPDGGGSSSFPGGMDGNGGAGGGFIGGGGGGGGFLSAGGNGTFDLMVTATGGGAFPNLTGGLSDGGFGGGGGADLAAGGGGGYSGGGGGLGMQDSSIAPGGGGGSFNSGIDQILVADLQTGNGEVVISVVFLGTPGPNCYREVVSALTLQYGDLATAAAVLGYSRVHLLGKNIAAYCAG